MDTIPANEWTDLQKEIAIAEIMAIGLTQLDAVEIISHMVTNRQTMWEYRLLVVQILQHQSFENKCNEFADRSRGWVLYTSGLIRNDEDDSIGLLGWLLGWSFVAMCYPFLVVIDWCCKLLVKRHLHKTAVDHVKMRRTIKLGY